jgi:DNA-binding CsgD family transcriptional regulator
VADALNVPISYFFNGLPAPAKSDDAASARDRVFVHPGGRGYGRGAKSGATKVANGVSQPCRVAANFVWAQVLSPRELDVASLVAGGLSNKEIARALGITEGTVKVHMNKLLRKLVQETGTLSCWKLGRALSNQLEKSPKFGPSLARTARSISFRSTQRTRKTKAVEHRSMAYLCGAYL